MANSKNTMDSISLPDKEKIDNMKGGFVSSRRVYKETSFDDFTNTVRADFDRATVVNVPTRTEEKTDDEDDFIPKPDPNRKANPIGVKVGSTYVAKTKVVKIVVICIVALALVIFFLPPLAVNDADVSKSESVNIFANKGLSELKEDIFNNTNVYNEEALSSERSENYRMVTVGMNLKNYTPFELKIPGYSIVTGDTMYKDKVVCAAPENEGGDVVEPFTSKTVKVKILINITDMDDSAFDEAVTSLVIRTSGMKKKIGKNTYCPCVPAFMFVSNAISFDKDK